ncbi:MAG: ATP-binding cassette domain-containing protein [Candidatus Marinimicrobia bacterium]|nr:ATP-binding cassette domain-containing protein [Candidatus Neomarinimicrobiota bacterium]
MKLLEVKDLTIRYGSLLAVRDLSFSVDEGETVVLLGPNGCGKSSVLLAIMGVVRPASGEILYLGQNLRNMKPWHRVAMGLAILPENRRLFDDLTVEENLWMALETLGKEIAFQGLQDALPESLRRRMKVPCRLLSGGERQLVAIARLKLQRPELALLDDPLAGVGMDLWSEVLMMVRGVKGTLLAAPRKDLPFQVDRYVDFMAR